MPPRETDDPRDRDLARRSGNPSVSIWLILMAIVLVFGTKRSKRRE